MSANQEYRCHLVPLCVNGQSLRTVLMTFKYKENSLWLATMIFRKNKTCGVAVEFINSFRGLTECINQKNLLSFGILVNVSDCTFLKQAQEGIPKSYDYLA